MEVRARSGVFLMCLVLLTGLLLAGCDPGVMIKLTRRGSEVFSCPDRQDMVYYVNIDYASGVAETRRAKFVQYSWKGTVSVSFVPSTFDKVKSVQFEVYCGDGEAPFLVSPVIRPGELEAVPGTRGLQHTFELKDED